MKRLLQILFYLCALGTSVHAADITIVGAGPASATLVNNWQGTVAPVLQAEYNSPFTASDGTFIGATMSAGRIIYQKVTCTLNTSTHVLTIPSFTVKSTEDGKDVRTSTISFYFYNPNGSRIGTFGNYVNLRVPATIISTVACSPIGTCCSFSDLAVYNAGAPRLPASTYYDARTVDQKIAAVSIGGFLTSLTGDVTTTGTGAVAATVVNVSDSALSSNIPKKNATSNQFIGSVGFGNTVPDVSRFVFVDVNAGTFASGYNPVGGYFKVTGGGGPGGEHPFGVYGFAVSDRTSLSSGGPIAIHGEADVSSGVSTSVAVAVEGQVAISGSTATTYGTYALSFAAGAGASITGTAYGAWQDVAVLGSATINNATGFHAQIRRISSGNITGAVKGIDLSGWGGGITPATSYGVYMDSSIDVGTTKYALYSLSTSPSLFSGVITQAFGGADPLLPPNLVGAQTVKLGSSAIINDSTSGDYRQISAHVTQQGTRNAVAGSFGTRCDGAANCWGINPWGYANASGATGIAIENNFAVLASGGLAYGEVFVVVGNFNATAFVQMQSGVSGISAANGIVINKGGTGLDPISGAIITTAGAPSMTNGVDLSGAGFSDSAIKLPNNVYIKALNNAAASKIITGMDSSNYTVTQSGGAGTRFPNAANTVNLLLLTDAGGATVTGGLSVLNNSSAPIFGVNEANGVTFHRKGADVASASSITPTGNSFHVTGTTNIDAISTTGITAGTTITLIFDGILIVGDAGNLKLASAFTTSADDSLTLLWDGSNWIEVARSVN